jgi:cysteine synthase A
VEATAGNTGVGLALIGVNRGYRVVLYVPEQFAEEKCILMRALGATVIRTPAEEGMAGAIRRALDYEWQTPGAFAALQFENPANPDFHEQTTAIEIWEQMEGHVDAWISGVGSAGTFTGVARFLKKKSRQIQCVAVEPQGSILQGGEPGPHKVEGIGVSFIPATFDANVCDRVIRVMDPQAFETVKRLAAEAGVFAGSSAGAMVAAAVEVAAELGSGQRVVTVIPDSAERYLSKGIFGG